MEEENEGFFQNVDSGSLWDTTDNPQGETVEQNIPAEPQGQPQPIDQGTPEGNPPAQEAQPGQIQFPEGFELKDVPEHMKPEDAYNMARYQQSKASRYENELRELKQKLEMQQLYSQMQQFGASGANQPGSTQAGIPQDDTPQKPTAPKRPANDDPYSDEFQAYQREVTQYTLDIAEYNSQMVERQTRKAQQLEQSQLAAQREQAAAVEFFNELKYSHGFTDQEANQFLVDVKSQDFMNDLGMWAQAWRLRKGGSNGQPNQRMQPSTNGQISQQVRQHQQTATSVPGTGAGAPPKEEESVFRVGNAQGLNNVF